MNSILKIIIFLFIIYLISAISLYFIQDKIIFQGVKLSSDYPFDFNQKFEEVNLKTNDNSIINALHFKVENSKGIVIYYHGNQGNLARWGTIASYFTQYNYDVFVMDYRTYGKSTGILDEKLLYNDAQLCYDYIKKQYPENKIILYGRSLGCTFATKIASENKPNQLILESPFYNLTHVANYHYPFMPFGLLMNYKFKSNTFIDDVNCKTIIFHGTKDKVVPFSSGEKLFSKSNKNNTSFFKIENGTHHNLREFKSYEKTIATLLD